MSDYNFWFWFAFYCFMIYIILGFLRIGTDWDKD